MEASTYDPADFPPFAVTADLVILTLRRDAGFEVLLVRRQEDPEQNKWALPGGFVGPEQSLVDAAQAKLADKTGINIDRSHLEQLETFGDPQRDPRMRVVTVAYLAFVPEPGPLTAPGAQWHSIDSLGRLPLAFDHSRILEAGLERARAKLEYTTLGTTFCAEEFTIVELRLVYESLWGIDLDAANFHRKVLACDGFIEPVGSARKQGKGRPAQLYRAGTARLLHPPIARPGETAQR